MIIRKKYRFEAAHMVRNCTSVLCRENIHGHSYIVEVFIRGNQLDNGCMLLDFCKLDIVKELINSFDHSYCLWAKEADEVKEAMYTINSRVVTMPISPSAEGYALLLYVMIKDLLEKMDLNNGEGALNLHSVRVHETETGYAEAFEEDLAMVNFSLEDISFTKSISDNWKLLQNK